MLTTIGYFKIVVKAETWVRGEGFFSILWAKAHTPTVIKLIWLGESSSHLICSFEYWIDWIDLIPLFTSSRALRRLWLLVMNFKPGIKDGIVACVSSCEGSCSPVWCQQPAITQIRNNETLQLVTPSLPQIRNQPSVVYHPPGLWFPRIVTRPYKTCQAFYNLSLNVHKVTKIKPLQWRWLWSYWTKSTGNHHQWMPSVSLSSKDTSARFVWKEWRCVFSFKISELMHKKLTGNLNILTKANLIKAWDIFSQ